MKQLIIVLILALPLSCYAESRSEKTARQAHEQILQESPIYEQKALTDYVERIGQQVVQSSGVKKPQFTFTVIDDQTINAFALPGGYIYIHRGLLTYLNSEAQLAAVLAHEVGHVTKKHHGRRNRAVASNTLVAGVLGVLSGSGDVAEASGLWGQTLVSGFGRNMELEADQVGAQYLVAAGYKPQAVIDVITLLKDHERLEKKRARQSGKKVQTYHGLFATHPRNDKRLREAVNQAGKLENNTGVSNVHDFRLATEGLVWGKNFGQVTLPDNVYQNEKYAFRFNIPTNWVFEDTGNSIIGTPQAAEGEKIANELINARMEITLRPRTTEPPDQYIKNRLNIPMLKKSEAITFNRLAGHTGVIPAQQNQGEQRLFVLYYSRHAYLFRGDLTGSGIKEQDKVYRQIAASFRPISRRAIQAKNAKSIHYVKATATTDFAKLAQHFKLGKYGEDELRIINGYYPAGQPKAGDWIKIIR